jgi:uncharacterized protein YuzE
MVANVLEGMEHEEATRLAGLSRSAAYEWHNRYEVDGIEGCATGRSSLRHGLWIQCHDAPAAYDTEADTVFVWFGPEGTKSAWTQEVALGILLDFDCDGRVIGIDVLDGSERMTRPRAAA